MDPSMHPGPRKVGIAINYYKAYLYKRIDVANTYLEKHSIPRENIGKDQFLGHITHYDLDKMLEHKFIDAGIHNTLNKLLNNSIYEGTH